MTAPLIYLSFPAYDTPVSPFMAAIAWVSLVPLMRYARNISLRELFFAAFTTALVGFFITFGWMGSFAGDIPFGNILLITPFIPVISVIFATKFLLSEALFRYTGRGRCFIYAAVWILIDFFQLFGYMAFPWIYWGNTQYAFTPLIQLASITGVFGVTFLIILFNAALSQAEILLPLTKKTFLIKQNQPLYASVAIVILVIIFGTVRLALHPLSSKGEFTVAQVQTCISPWEDWYEHRYSYMRDLVALTTDAAREEPLDLVVWNEATSLETLSYSYRNNSMNSYEYTIFELAKYLRVPLLTGEIGQYDSGGEVIYTNGAVVINGIGTLQDSYSKIHLAPIGETFPYGKYFPKLQKYLESMGASSFTSGTKPVIFSIPKAKFGVLICYESLFPILNRHYKREGVDFLVNITNDGWSHFYSGHMQHYSGSPFRAVENGLYYVRCGNTGFTTVADPYGRKMGSIPLLKKGFMREHLDFSQNHTTFYSLYGDIFVYTAGVISFLLICCKVLSQLKLNSGSKVK